MSLQRTLAALILGVSTLAASPLALAGPHHDDHGWQSRHEHHHGWHDRSYHHDAYRPSWHHAGHGRFDHDRHHPSHHARFRREPPRSRVVVIEREVHREHAPAFHRPSPHYPQRTQADHYSSATPMVVGGIVGGLLGNRVGKGRGRDVATVAGVVLGASVGHDLARR